MNQKISGPAGVAIVVVVAVIIFAGLYMKYFHQPTKSAAETQAGLASGFQKMQAYMKQKGETSNFKGPGAAAPAAGQSTGGG